MKVFIGMFSFPALKAPGVRDCSHESRGCYYIPHIFGFEFLFSLIIKKLLNRLKFYFLILVLMIMMASLFWFLSQVLPFFS